MLKASAERIHAMLPDDALVLDVGGGASPFARADWVIDLMAYEERGLYGPTPDAAAERFDATTWVKRDICAREPWPFAADQFDFVVCSHLLEDVRDPIAVCEEIVRVGRAGYVEVPSRLEEQSYGFQGPWAGWGHHRWLIDASEDELTFVFKHHVLHNRAGDHFPPGFRETVAAEDLVHCVWWAGGFRYRERIFLDAPALDSYLADFVATHAPAPAPRTAHSPGVVSSLRRRLAGLRSRPRDRA
jgi:SAM-dependent methyltransferase